MQFEGDGIAFHLNRFVAERLAAEIVGVVRGIEIEHIHRLVVCGTTDRNFTPDARSRRLIESQTQGCVRANSPGLVRGPQFRHGQFRTT